MEEITYDCLIVGGGISGISFAHFLTQQGKKVLILEKEKNIGGQIQSPASSTAPDYWREMGAHTCYNSYTHLLSIVKAIGEQQQIQELGKGSWMIYAKDKVTSPMTQIAYPSLLLNGPKLFFSKRDDKTVKEYFQNIVGKKNYEKLFTYMFHAVLSQNADNYPAELFLKRRNGRDEDFPRKYTFSGGLNNLLQQIVKKDEIEVISEAEVTEVSYLDELSTYEVTTADGTSYTAPNIAFASDPQTTAQLINDIEDELAELLRTIPMFHSESMNVIVAKDKLKLKPMAGIISVSDEFHSTVSRDLVDDEKLRSFTFHFTQGTKTLDEKLALASKVLEIKQEDILEHSLTAHVLPSLRMQHLSMEGNVKAFRKREDMYILGNYFYGLSIEDCVNRSSDEAERFARNG